MQYTHSVQTVTTWPNQHPGGGGHNPNIRLVELASGKQVSAFGEHNPSSIAISPDGLTLAAGHWDIVALWKHAHPANGSPYCGDFGRYVSSVSFSRDGQWLAAGTDTGGPPDLERAPSDEDSVSQNRWRTGVCARILAPDGRTIGCWRIRHRKPIWLIEVSTGTILDHQRGLGSWLWVLGFQHGRPVPDYNHPQVA